MTITNKGFFSLYITLLAISLIFSSCENPGSVGSDYVERPAISHDTLYISATPSPGLSGYSGRLTFLPAGYYSDPVFGDITANALVRPARTATIPDSIEMGDNFTLQLELRADSLENYGDTTLSQASYNIYEVTSTWRGRSLRIDNDIQYGNLVGSFTLNPGKRDVIIDDLSPQWIDTYKTFYESEDANIDSSYNYNFGGLIIVPDQGNTKLFFPRSDLSRFLMINEAGTDTVIVPFRDWGFTINRNNSSIPQNTFSLHTTLESMVSIPLPNALLKDRLKNQNIVRADLIFYEAEQELSSSLSPNHVRNIANTLKIHFPQDLDPAYEYQFGSGTFIGFKNQEDALYKINITNYVNNVVFGNESREELILGVGSSTGTIRSALLYNESAENQYRPKIVVTSLTD